MGGVCNFCESLKECRKDKYFYNPDEAEKLAVERNTIERRILNITKKELAIIDMQYSDMIKKGLSIEVIEASLNDDEKIRCSRTIRNYVNNNYLTARKHDLPRFVQRKCKKCYSYRHSPSRDPLIKIGRTFTCFKTFISLDESKDKEIVQCDTVHDTMSNKDAVLTLHFVSCNF